MDKLTMYLYGIDYMLFSVGMTLTVEGEDHNVRITEMENVVFR